jgi:3-hydroxyisobutyrate dehydrogenase-like beta-hydroxyacid dehydrogenase
MSLDIAFVGYGEVGQLFSRQLLAKPGVRIAAYDILFDDPAKGPELRRRAAESGVRAAASTDELVRQGGASFVEFAVMAPVSGPGIEVPILSGGQKAQEVSTRLNQLGMKITPVSTEIGTASASKLCRSIVIKGMEALMVDFTLASERAGVMPAVLDSLKASYPGMDWENVAKVMLSRVRQHGVRRAAEMREASRMIAELGLDGSLASAIADRQESFAKGSAGT